MVAKPYLLSGIDQLDNDDDVVVSFGNWKKRSLFDVLSTEVDACDEDSLVSAVLEVLPEKFARR